MKTDCAYVQIPSRFGAVGLVWSLGEGGDHTGVNRILLPVEGFETEKMIKALYPGAVERSNAVIGPIRRRIRRLLEGGVVDFTLNELDMNICGAFQLPVLRLAFQIPRGSVSTYGGLADKVGHPLAARAVGSALARNPFPLVIPCHRAIRGDRTLGGYGGGLEMKRAFLEMEGVRFDSDGKIIKDCIV